MRKIIRKIIERDFAGQLLSMKTERLTDDEAGTVEETNVTRIKRCEACRRPLEKTDQMRGICISCGMSCCSICHGFCAVCGCGPFCGRCKTGFPERGLSVCSDCLAVLKDRLAYQDKLLEEKASFERLIAVYTAQLKFIQLLQHNKGSISGIVSRIAQARIARKIRRLERQLEQEKKHGKRLLP